MQRIITIGLCCAILLLGTGITRNVILAQSHRSIAITCTVAVKGGEGEICIQAEAGVKVQISIEYSCNHAIVNSPVLMKQEPGTDEYRWTWQVETPCIAETVIEAANQASWPDGGVVAAVARFALGENAPPK